MAEIRGSFSARFCGIVIYDHSQGLARWKVVDGLSAEDIQQYETQYAKTDAWLCNALNFCEIGSVLRSGELLTDEQLMETAFYRDWLKPRRLAHHAFGVLDRSGQGATYLVLGRSVGQRPFGGRDVSRIRPFARALYVAWGAEKKAQVLTDERQWLWQVLDLLRFGVAFVDGTGRVHGVNRQARRILGMADRRSNGNGENPMTPNANLAPLRKCLADIAAARKAPVGNGGGRAVTLRREDGSVAARGLVIALQPATAHGEIPLYAALLFVPDGAPAPRQDWLMDLYGLSRVEADIASLLCQTRTPDEIADLLRISVHTVRSHMKDIFLKVDVGRQTALVSRILSEVGGLLSVKSPTIDEFSF
jgi:DNA-binding CsgD family transcriptional regulator